MKNLLSTLILLFSVAAFGNVLAQDSKTTPPVDGLSYLPALAGDYFPFDSASTGRQYHIFVRLPEGYDADDTETKYPVVYLTDGDSTFPMLAPLHLFMHYDDKTPDAIIVGIAYGSFNPTINKRGIDYAEVEGAAAYERFLAEELIPEIETKFNGDPQRRILFGQSHGGSFVLFSAYSRPDLFWGRIASNPSYKANADAYLSSPTDGVRDDLKLVVTSGTKDRDHLREKALAWSSYINGKTDLPWEAHFISLKDGTHAADAHRSYRSGISIIFDQKDQPQ